jgi:hypothetical protein
LIDESTDGPRQPSGAMQWRKSTFSATSECVVLADIDGLVAVRNSKHPESGTLLFSRVALASWVAGCQSGQFDDLTKSPH